LHRLESAGCLTTYSVAHNGRLRKFYSVTDAGREQVDAFLRSWPELAAMHDFIEGSVEK
jgi:PadR family transcriptional regulator PadR